MRTLALSDDILLNIEKPARYIGGEVNSVMKDKSEVDIRFAMCFPDVYEIGMSHLGIQILYDMFNRREDVWCERVYSPWTDLDKVMREQAYPAVSHWNLRIRSKTFDFLGITLQYEMCYTNILQVLELGPDPASCQRANRGRSDRHRWRSVRVQSGTVGRIFRSVLYRRGRDSYTMNFLDLYKECKKEKEIPD